MSQSWMCVTLVRTQAGSFPGLNQTVQEPHKVQPYIVFSNIKKASMTEDIFSQVHSNH